MGWEDMFRRLRTRVDSMITRAVIKRVNEELNVQRFQVSLMADEDGEWVTDDVDHLQAYGVSFKPPAGAEALVLNVGARSNHPVAILAHHPGQRPTDADDGCGGLHTAGVWRLYIDTDGVLHLGAKEGSDFVALASKVEAELNNIATTLGSLAGQASFGTPYTGPTSVAATQTKAT